MAEDGRQVGTIEIRHSFHPQIAGVTAADSGVDDTLGVDGDVWVEFEQVGAIDVMQVGVACCHEGIEAVSE